MSRVTAPLLSFGASGQVAKSQVYSTWKGVPYVRRYVIPANPKSTEQTLTRNTFSNLNALYKFSPSSVTSAFDAAAKGKALTGRNAFIKSNLAGLREQADLAALLMSPGALGGFTAAGITLTPGATQISAALDQPSLPSGWSIAAAWAVAVKEQDPQTGTDWQTFSATNAVAPYTVVIPGLTTATLYRVAAWFTFLRPDGLTAYGASISDTATPT